MSDKEFEAQLTLKDRLNFPYLLANQILTFQKSILNLQFSDREIREAIEGLVHLIPEAWKDNAFKEDMEKAKKTLKIDIRPSWCGLRASVESCKQLGIDTMSEKEVYDYYKLFQACMNLLNRRKMLSRIMRVEVLEGIDFDNPKEDEVFQGDLLSE